MTTGTVAVSSAHDGTPAVFLNEKVVPVDVSSGTWYLDSGASSHMSGARSSPPWMRLHGTVKFGDGSLVNI